MGADSLQWKTVLVQGRVRLEQAGIDEPAQKIRWVAAHLLDCGLLDVLRYLEEPISQEHAQAFAAAVARLEADEPVQYVIGETDFMGLRIRCSPEALIPRPETELLVGCAEDFLRTRPGRPVALDVCTGTGCIACALAWRVPQARILASDISPAALELARENARALEANVAFAVADLLDGVPENSVDLVVSNPPYISSAECARLPRCVRDYEPRLALDGGADGLRLISRLVEGAARVLQSGGRLMMEIGDDQAEAVTEILCRTTPFQNPTVKSDYAGRARVASAERKSR